MDKSAFPAGTTPSYTLHLSVCNGGTDEAFGQADAAEMTTTTTTAAPTTVAPTATPTTAPPTTVAPTTTVASTTGAGTPTNGGGGGSTTEATVAGVVLSRNVSAAAPTAAPASRSLRLPSHEPGSPALCCSPSASP